MKRALSIISIIFLLGITTAMPYFSCSSFIYADENTEVQLTDNEILNAGISVYLNSRNGFITIADGTINGAKLLMNNTIDSFINFYNANHSIQDQIEKSSLVGSILVKYNPFRVQLKGFAISVFNDLYDYLEDQGKVNNASNSDGGETTDNLYDGYLHGDSLFYIFNLADKGTNFNYVFITDTVIGVGTPVNGFNADYIKSIALNGKNVNLQDENQSALKLNPLTNITYSANVVVSTYNLWVGNKTNYAAATTLFGQSIYPAIMNSSLNFPLYSDRSDIIRGNTAWIIDRNVPNELYWGFVSYNYSKSLYYIYKLGHTTLNNESSNITQEVIDFETDDFIKTPTSEPEEGKEVQYTPKDKTTGNTYNTYNEYINNYTNKNTVINKKVINEGDSEVDNPTDPTNPSNPTDPSQPTTQNPYPLDPTDPSAPTGGTVPDWTTPSGNGGSGTITPDGNGGYTFELPDFSLPDLDINWSISGLSEKFPFSIPFDLLAFFTVLNAEPQTPAIQATIPLGIWEWEIDWDLHDFDNLAGLLRNLEFIGFCIGLALITRNIIKG